MRERAQQARQASRFSGLLLVGILLTGLAASTGLPHRMDLTEDGEFTLLPVVCLGNCDNAPTLMINDDLYDRVSPDAVDSILKAVRGHGGDHG